MVEGGGFEPPKVEPADLQSAPFDRSGTPPKIKPHILLERSTSVNRNLLKRRLFFCTAKLYAVTVFQTSASLKNQQKSRRIKTPTASL
jgi:hypothetical protein